MFIEVLGVWNMKLLEHLLMCSNERVSLSYRNDYENSLWSLFWCSKPTYHYNCNVPSSEWMKPKTTRKEKRKKICFDVTPQIRIYTKEANKKCEKIEKNISVTSLTWKWYFFVCKSKQNILTDPNIFRT